MSGDYDAFLRISYKWEIDYVDKPLARYRVHRNSKSWRDGRKLVTVEIDLMMDNLRKSVNEFDRDYPEEIRHLKRRRDVQLSLLDWENGDRKKARIRLHSYVRDGISYLTLYFLTYLSYRFFFYPFYRLYTKNLMAD
jgi:hypothetical protein